MKRLGARQIKALSTFALVVIVLFPWAKRLERPSIVWDDVQRVADLQTLSLPARMVRPFNEHVAPFFELITAAAWEVAGHRLANVPVAFTYASYLPFVLCLGMLWVLVRREWKSTTAASLAIVLFACTPIYAECVFWFSASTFTWALLFTMLALYFASFACERESIRWSLASAIACLLAPMGSAIGLLAGPVAVIRGWPSRRPKAPLRSEFVAIVPILGTLANLAIGYAFRSHQVLGQSFRTHTDVLRGLAKAVQAPLYFVVTGYGGWTNAQNAIPFVVSALFLLLVVTAVAWKAWTGTHADRRWLAIGVFLIGSGYAMIYGFRTRQVGLDSLLTIQRYHLFPCFGLILLILVATASLMRRIDDRPRTGSLLPLGLAILLIVINQPLMKKRSHFSQLIDDQRPLLATMDRMGESARSAGVSREQMIHAFLPIEPRWTAPGLNVLTMLPLSSRSSQSPHEAEAIRAVVERGLSAQDRSLLSADRNATVLLRSASQWNERSGSNAGRLVATQRVQPLDQAGRYQSEGWPAHLEYAFSPNQPKPKAISLPALDAGRTLELWWTEADNENWSHTRSLVLRLESPNPSQPTDWVLPLDQRSQIPPTSLKRLRITPREAGPIAIGTPSLWR